MFVHYCFCIISANINLLEKQINALILLWKYIALMDTLGESQSIPRGTRNHTLKTMVLPDSLAFFFNWSRAFQQGRYEESFVKDCRTIQEGVRMEKEFSMRLSLLVKKFCPRKHQVCTASFLIPGCLAFSQGSPRMRQLLCPHADSKWSSTWTEPMWEGHCSTSGGKVNGWRKARPRGSGLIWKNCWK